MTGNREWFINDTEKAAVRGAGAGCDEAHFAIQIDNYNQILAVYGQSAAEYVAAKVGRDMENLVQGAYLDSGTVLPGGDGSLDIVIRCDAIACHSFMQTCIYKITTTAIMTEDKAILPLLSFAAAPRPVTGDTAPPAPANMEDRDAILFSAARRALVGKPATWAWAILSRADHGHYAADMACAAGLIAETEPKQLSLAWQPVHHADGSSEQLYSEALLRSVDSRGQFRSVSDGIEALERLGLVRALDYRVVCRVISELASDPNACLGVNISAQSAVLDNWWDEILTYLEGDRLLARRLFIEITESTPLLSISQAVAFVEHVRGLGCRVVVDDFGAGYSSILTLLALKPDVVKVDRMFMIRATGSDEGQKLFGHLVQLAQSIASIIIVEGVKSSQDAEAARAAGARWLQGYYFGLPSMLRNREYRNFDNQAPRHSHHDSDAEVAGAFP